MNVIPSLTANKSKRLGLALAAGLLIIVLILPTTVQAQSLINFTKPYNASDEWITEKCATFCGVTSSSYSTNPVTGAVSNYVYGRAGVFQGENLGQGTEAYDVWTSTISGYHEVYSTWSVSWSASAGALCTGAGGVSSGAWEIDVEINVYDLTHPGYMHNGDWAVHISKWETSCAQLYWASSGSEVISPGIYGYLNKGDQDKIYTYVWTNIVVAGALLGGAYASASASGTLNSITIY
jgi:hypothetical protein